MLGRGERREKKLLGDFVALILLIGKVNYWVLVEGGQTDYRFRLNPWLSLSCTQFDLRQTCWGWNCSVRICCALINRAYRAKLHPLSHKREPSHTARMSEQYDHMMSNTDGGLGGFFLGGKRGVVD